MRQHIFDTICTTPIDLIRLVDETRHNVSLIEFYLDYQLLVCKSELMALFSSRESPSGQEFDTLARFMLASSSLSVIVTDAPKKGFQSYSNPKGCHRAYGESCNAVSPPETRAYTFVG